MKAFGLLLIFCMSSCGPIEPEPPKDKDGKEIPLPEVFDTFLSIKEILPKENEIALSPKIWIRFSDYLDNDEWSERNTLYLSSGGLQNRGSFVHLFSQKALIFSPRSRLVEGLEYSLTLRSSDFYSSNKAPLLPNSEPTIYTASSKVESLDFELPNPSWSEVKGIFKKKCDSCHSDPKWGLVNLDYKSLVGKKSTQVDRFLVRAFDSPDSYLVQKILPDFDERKFTVQPPPWSDGEALTNSEILIIDRWVQLGANLEN